jgi:hypothetical protein
METHMDAEAKKAVLDNALDRLTTGGDVMPPAVFDAGYGHGLSQGHYDRAAETAGVEAGGEVLPAQYALQFRVPGRGWVNGTTWMDERYMHTGIEELLERYQRTADADEHGEEWRAVVARPQPVPRHLGGQAASHPREAARQPLAASEPEGGCQQAAAAEPASGASKTGRFETPPIQAASQSLMARTATEVASRPDTVCQSRLAVNGEHDWDSYLGACALCGDADGTPAVTVV